MWPHLKQRNELYVSFFQTYLNSNNDWKLKKTMTNHEITCSRKSKFKITIIKPTRLTITPTIG